MDDTSPATNGLPGASQSGYGQARGIQARWQSDGVTHLPLPPYTAVVMMRGGHTLAQATRGDDVDLFVTNEKGKGEWRSGYTAISGLTDGEMGGPYDGEDVVVVCKTEDFSDNADKYVGAEWPASGVRLSKGDKPTTDERLAGKTAEGDTEPAKFYVDYALFFRPDQLRGYHGRWINEGKGDLRAKHPMGEMVSDAIVGETANQYRAAVGYLASIGFTPEKLKKRALEIYDLQTPEQKASLAKGETWATPEFRTISQSWYYEVHDLAWEWAKKFDLRPEIVAALIANYSPQVAWGEPRRFIRKGGKGAGGQQLADVYEGSTPGMFMVSNQGFAWKALRAMFTIGDQEITITPESAAAGNALVKKANEKINYESYNGADKSSPWYGRSLMGKHKINELTGDVVRWQLPKDMEGMMGPRTAKAFMLLRGMHPDAPNPMASDKKATVLNGPKIRSFYNDIINPDAALDSTMDVHMIHAITRLDLTSEEAQKLVDSPGAYKLLSDTLADAAKERGIKPHEFQAAVWIQWRKMHPDEEKRAVKKARKEAEAASEGATVPFSRTLGWDYPKGTDQNAFLRHLIKTSVYNPAARPPDVPRFYSGPSGPPQLLDAYGGGNEGPETYDDFVAQLTHEGISWE